MSTMPTCPECGAPLPADAPQGLCPKCLLRHGMDGTLTSSEPQTTPILIANPTPLTAPATIRYFGDYELDHEIARGGMGAVFKARQVKLNRPVAVKMILERLLSNEAMVKRFYTEAEAAANLQHPNIVAIHEIGAHDRQHYFSMDYVEGKNLAQLTAGKPLSPARAARYVQSMAVAIHYAHQRGTLHRDLKPSNVLIDEHDQPRITDFGLAKLTQNGSHLTIDGAVMGTPSYMSPEQAAGRQDQVGPHSDVYSLGAILYELLTGKPPFQAATLMATMRAVIESDPVAPRKLNPDVPLDIETICLKCLEKSPQRRYPSARELAEELGRFLKGEPILARPASIIRKTASWTRQHPGQVAALTALLILALVFFVYYLTERIAFLSDHTRQREPRAAALMQLKQLTQIVSASVFGLCVLACVLAWFPWRKRGSMLEAAFDRVLQYQPTPSALRAVLVTLGLIPVVLAIYATGIFIQEYVWEGVTPSFMAGAWTVFAGLMGVGLLSVVVQDYRRSIFGLPSLELAADQNEAIRRAVMEYDIPGATRIYRQAVPELGRTEADKYVSQLVAELGVQPPAFSLRTLNWRSMAICAGIETLVVAGLWLLLWLLFHPAQPMLYAALFGTGLFLGMWQAALPRFKGIWKRTLGAHMPGLNVPGAIAIFVLVYEEIPRLANYGPFLIGGMCGCALMSSGFTPNRHKTT